MCKDAITSQYAQIEGVDDAVRRIGEPHQILIGRDGKSVQQATNEAGIPVSLANRSDAKLTREEAALILQNTLHLPDKSESFQDVADECGYAGAIGAVADTSILAGVSSQKFGYGEYLTSTQQSEMISRLKTYYADRQKSYASFKAAALQFNPVMHDRDGNDHAYGYA